MTPNNGIIQRTSLFGPFDNAKRHKYTFRTKHDTISSKLIA
jgi:hypothetical protein